MKQDLEPIVVAELDALELDLVELRVGGSRNRPVLDIRVDRRDLQKVQVGDCERASRAIEARLDAVPGIIDSRYVLEVSSPGMERPLHSLADWRRFVGRRANVTSAKLAAVGGRAEVEIVAVVGDEGDERIVVRDPKGTEQQLAMADVSEALLAFHWKP
ncbi:MAG: ribosome maturation factor RimP [Gemmatimonadetes bacterium]|nr:ribosome maturation factor RimP [Gemmatimonadota bacterium]